LGTFDKINGTKFSIAGELAGLGDDFKSTMLLEFSGLRKAVCNKES
jgi:mannose/fructose/N-acetylgalactosamine-specific phosphotransferase system component IID